MERRALGHTGLEVTILGLGGFHLLDVSTREAEAIVHRYLDAGGNYVETAGEYGDGASEMKLGRALAGRRQECILATKCHLRDKSGAAALIDRSLRNLRTDYLDILYLHHVQTMAELDRIMSPDGALQAAADARRAGKIGFLGISGHGVQQPRLAALERHPFEVVMTQFNYYDRFNFPETEGELLPLALQKGMGVVGFKAVGDGFLYRSVEPAFRYAWSLPIHTMVAGINTLEILERDLALAEAFVPLTQTEIESWLLVAPELGNYVCRQCGKCLPVPGGLNIPRIFMLEGWYDRQMWDAVVRDAPDYHLRWRLGHWFEQEEMAREAYAAEPVKVDPEAEYSDAEAQCPYGIPVTRKLRIAHAKLSREVVLF
jgi:predicted aldo/keto reductase-like oxidoreductase